MPASNGSVAPARSTSTPATQVKGSSYVIQQVGADIEKKLKGTPLQGTGITFAYTGYKYGIDPWFLVSSAQLESQLGTKGFATNGSHNPFGLGVTGAPGAGFRYGSWQAAIDAAGRNLAGPLYRGDKRFTLDGIYSRWSTANDSPRLAAIYKSLTGRDASGSTVVLAPGANSVVYGGKIYQGGQINGDILNAAASGAATTAGAISDAVPGDPLSAIATAIGTLADIIKFIADPAMWLRVGEMAVGVIGMVAGGYLLFKGGDSGKPIGVFVTSVGFMWVYCGVKSISPVDFLKKMVGA